jgi:hypothetical protein
MIGVVHGKEDKMPHEELPLKRRHELKGIKKNSPAGLKAMNHDLEISNKIRRLQGKRDPGTVFTPIPLRSTSITTIMQEFPLVRYKRDDLAIGVEPYTVATMLFQRVIHEYAPVDINPAIEQSDHPDVFLRTIP